MATIPSTSKCPIKDKSDGVCMCYPPNQCESLQYMGVCGAIRSAYAFGCNQTETKYTNALVEKITELRKTLMSLSKEEDE